MFWLGLLIGIFVGALLGVFVMSMMALAKRADERECVDLEDWDDEDWDEGDRQMARETLPHRRFSQTFALEWGGYRAPHFVTCGFYEDGRLGEVFIGAGKSGEQVEAVARDGAILLSIALQHGAQLSELSHAITRNSRHEPMSIVGAVIDCLVKLNQGAEQ
jgi:hypothetical protein